MIVPEMKISEEKYITFLSITMFHTAASLPFLIISIPLACFSIFLLSGEKYHILCLFNFLLYKIDNVHMKFMNNIDKI